MEVNNILFIGTGGGNDIFSTMLAMQSLWRRGWRWKNAAVAGVLSPFHMHTTLPTHIEGMVTIKPETQRFLNRGLVMGSMKKIGFIDATVSKMFESNITTQQGGLVNIRRTLGLSLSEGTAGLTRVLKALAATFDHTVLVDIGGDILYRGTQDTHILSPMFDACVLRAAVDSGIPCTLFEAGPGTDGEMDPEALEDALKKSQAQRHLIHKDDMTRWEELYKQWIELVRPGRTVPYTIEAFYSGDDELVKTYRARAHLGDIRRYANFEQRISTRLCRSYFLIDPHNASNPFAVACTDPEDWFIKTQVMQGHTNNEANLEYMLRGHELLQFLTPSPLLQSDDRRFLIETGLKEMQQEKTCQVALMLQGDIAQIPDLAQRGFTVLSKGPYSEVRAL